MNKVAKLVDRKQTDPIEAVSSLIPACLAGSSKARETLARWCLPKIQRTVILTYGRGADADDLIQMAIFRVIDKLSSYRGDAGFYTWVDRITINVLRDYFRNKKSRNRFEVQDSPNLELVSKVYPDREFERIRLLECLSVHLSAIKMDRRLPLVLNLAHGYTAFEIGVMLEIKEEAAKKRIQRARMELLKVLKKDVSFMEMFKEVVQ